MTMILFGLGCFLAGFGFSFILFLRALKIIQADAEEAFDQLLLKKAEDNIPEISLN